VLLASATWRPDPDVIGRRTGETAVLVQVGSGRIFELNATGAVIWDLISAGAESDAIVLALTEQFEVSDTQASDELTRLVGELRAAGLLTS
jgi:hypothetical protein